MQASRMLLLSAPLTSLHPPHHKYAAAAPRRPTARFTALKVRAMAKGEKTESGGNDAVSTAAIAAGLISNPIIGWSLYTLKTTGCGLPPGPGGSIGALEGVSYLAVVGIVGWSAYTKSKTGSVMDRPSCWEPWKGCPTYLSSPLLWFSACSLLSRAPFPVRFQLSSALVDLLTVIVVCNWILYTYSRHCFSIPIVELKYTHGCSLVVETLVQLSSGCEFESWS